MTNNSKLAEALYEADKHDPKTWLEVFTKEELVELWDKDCAITENNPFGAGYDDEVYEALKLLNYFN